MTENAALNAHRDNSNSRDHFPICPHCGNACGRLARVCADCGAFLYEPTPADRLERRDLTEQAFAALRREAVTPRKGTED